MEQKRRYIFLGLIFIIQMFLITFTTACIRVDLASKVIAMCERFSSISNTAVSTYPSLNNVDIHIINPDNISVLCA